MKKLSFLFTLALAAFCTTGCDSLNDLIDNIVNPSGDKEEPKDEKPAPTSVSLEVHGTSLEVGGDPYKIEYTVFPIEASQEVTFTSSNPAVASVDSTGYVTGVQEGTATITIATVANSTVTAAFAVSVTESGEEVENYVVTFYANGGVGHMDEDHTIGSLYVVPECEFSYDKHKFVAWALNGPSGAHYIPGEVMEQISVDIELYAVWEIIPDPVVTNYTVTFDANGGSGTMAPQTTTGSSYKAPECTFTKSGFVFVGWALNSPSGSVYYVNSTIEDIEANITLFAKWEENDVDPTDYYAGISKSLTGDSLLAALRALNKQKRTKTVGYNAMGTDPSGYFRYTDYDPATVKYDDHGQPYGTRLISFYSGNSAVSGMNREHVWPDSHGGNLVEADIHMPRPTLTAENGSRGNSFYVEGKKDTSKGWDPAMESFGVESYRGDSARIVFYCVVANNNLSLSELEYHETSKKNRDNLMGKLSDMLKWNLNYEVLDREQRRNAGAEYLQGNRNPFIDHPEYACKIWGGTNSATRTVCGM